jgi:heme/copper-type cytochrome/quinol oxidase subunit 1
MVLSALLFGEGTPDTGWTFYAPYSFRTGTNMLPAIFGAFVLGFSSILTGSKFFGYHSPYEVSRHEMDQNAIVCVDTLRDSLDSAAGYSGGIGITLVLVALGAIVCRWYF